MPIGVHLHRTNVTEKVVNRDFKDYLIDCMIVYSCFVINVIMVFCFYCVLSMLCVMPSNSEVLIMPRACNFLVEDLSS